MTERTIDARWLQDRIRLMLRPMSRMASAPPRTASPSAWWDGYHRALKDLELAVERRLRLEAARAQAEEAGARRREADIGANLPANFMERL